MLEVKQVGKHASTFFFLAFLHIYIFIIYTMMLLENLHMFDAMKTHGTLTRLNKKLGKYERLCMIRMENFERIENVKTVRF